MRECELCGLRARIHCEADQANLCWDCDEKVHGANFLVAKHPRSLLCHGCQSPTPWAGSGPKLTPTVSVCEICVERRGSSKIERCEVQESEAENEDDDDDGDGDDGDDDEDDEDEDGDEDGDEDENQVVPWSCCSYSTAEPPPAASCSSSDEEAFSFSFSKRLRENNADVDFDETASSSGSMRRLKRARLGEEKRLPSQRSTGIVSSIQRLQNQTDVINEGDDSWDLPNEQSR